MADKQGRLNSGLSKLAMCLLGSGATVLIGWGIFYANVSTAITQGKANTLAIAEESQQRNAQNLETQQDITELKTDIKYIRQGVDELRLEMRKVPY